jgi:UDP-N-acetylmuramyl pentapeptide phosphotransferase/UDP-N-acetylglucosamine-1-phosphate transferase
MVVGVYFAITFPVVVFPQKATAISLSVPILIAITILFFKFLVDMLRGVRRRNSGYIAFFIAINISAMITLFANIYRWVGLRYVVSPTTDKH